MSQAQYEIKAGAVVEILRKKGFDAVVEQTGGSTATIRAVKDGQVLLGGPGSFDWAEPMDSVLYTGDLWVGLMDDDDADQAEPGATAEQVAEMFVKVLGR